MKTFTARQKRATAAYEKHRERIAAEYQANKAVRQQYARERYYLTHGITPERQAELAAKRLDREKGNTDVS